MLYFAKSYYYLQMYKISQKMKSELNKKLSEGSITYVEEEKASPFEN